MSCFESMIEQQLFTILKIWHLQLILSFIYISEPAPVENISLNVDLHPDSFRLTRSWAAQPGSYQTHFQLKICKFSGPCIEDRRIESVFEIPLSRKYVHQDVQKYSSTNFSSGNYQISVITHSCIYSSEPAVKNVTISKILLINTSIGKKALNKFFNGVSFIKKYLPKLKIKTTKLKSASFRKWFIHYMCEYK